MSRIPPSPPHPTYPGVDIPPLDERTYERPVAWLLGRQLISSFKSTLLYLAFKDRIDARDWMLADEYPHAEQTEADAEWQRQADRNAKEKPGDAHQSGGEFWFDFIADTGDGMRATYSLAYLCLSDLWIDQPPGGAHDCLPSGPLDVGFVSRRGFTPTLKPDEYANKRLNRDALDAGQLRLPRGQFLLIGGDTAYHLSDYESLDLRFKRPFAWAFHDLVEDGRMWKADDVQSWDELRRPLFGIPANHDYYDQLDGFRRQFHHPVKKDKEPPANDPFAAPQLMLPGFRRCQHASYLALRLPFDWQLWGLDTELGKVDERQRNFFRRIVKLRHKVKQGEEDRSIDELGTPGKMIVVTCSPTTVFGKYADKDDEKAAKAFLQLGLSRPFLDPKEVQEHAAQGHAPEREDIGTTELEKGQCRLDLSGDIHLYARYWGPEMPNRPRAHSDTEADKERSAHYASVVSGLGGAFHHPSTTYAGEIGEQVLYPSVDESRKEVAKRLLSPTSELPWSLIPSWNIIRGGGVWAIGFLIAFLIYFASTFAQSSSQAVQNFPPFVRAGITSKTRVVPTVASGSRQFITFWGAEGTRPPADYWWGILLLFASLLLIFAAIYFAERIYKKYKKHEEVRTKAQPASVIDDEMAGVENAPPGQTTQATQAGQAMPTPLQIYKATRGEFEAAPESEPWYKWLMLQFLSVSWVLVALSTAALLVGVLKMLHYRDSLTPFGNSSLVLFSLLWAGAAIFIVVRYTDWLGKMTSKITIKARYWALALFLSVAAALSVVSGFALFGLKNTAADMITDILLIVVVGFLVLGLTLLGVSKIGEVTEGPKGKLYGLLGGLIGFFHAVLQIAVPFLLVYKGSWRTLLIAAVLLVLMPVFGWLLMRRNYYKLLLALWLVYGLAMLLLPYVTFYLFEYTGRTPFLAAFERYLGVVPAWAQDDSWRMLLACFAAGLVGLLLSCAWVAWYFGVALLYHGHNNEAGGAARIENFKQFIRFRVTENDITGFVIAVDEPHRSGRDLMPRLIDMFRLHVKQ